MELSSISTGHTLEVHIYNSFFISPLEVHIYNFFSISPLEVHIYNSFSISLCALCTVMKLQEPYVSKIKETFFINMNASCQISKMIISTFSNSVFSINILSPYLSFFYHISVEMGCGKFISQFYAILILEGIYTFLK